MKNKILYSLKGALFLTITTLVPIFSFADTVVDGEPVSETILHEKPSLVPEKVGVVQSTSDEQIAQRLEDIMQTTGWFAQIKVTVKRGVVFLYGETKNHQFKNWAGDLAHHTQDVTAVVNKIAVDEPSAWDIHLILKELQAQWHKVLRSIPACVFATLILILSYAMARLVYRLVLYLFRHKMNQSLLHEVFARAVSIFVFVLGIYFIFEMADLTTMAVTILSGTGLVGIILGIAFRDITENFLASILLSIQNPFHQGDFVDIVCPVTGYAATGYIERLTLRVTILLMQDGNHLQIPNATVYKSNIRNYTSNPHRRDDFVISIGSECSVSKAVEAALKILVENKAVLKDPEPLVLAEGLEKDTVKLHIYYWVDTRKDNFLKIKSSVIRLIKQALQDKGITLPAQETIQPNLPAEPKKKEGESAQTTSETKSDESQQIKKIKGPSNRPPEPGKNLLNPPKKEDKE